MKANTQKRLYKAWIELVSRDYEDDKNNEVIESYFDTEQDAIAWLDSYSPFTDYDTCHCSLGDRGVDVVIEEF